MPTRGAGVRRKFKDPKAAVRRLEVARATRRLFGFGSDVRTLNSAPPDFNIFMCVRAADVAADEPATFQSTGMLGQA